MIGIITSVVGLIILLVVGRTRRRDSDAELKAFEQYLWRKYLTKGMVKP